ncbi:MAG TPA: MBL fold metallo-hydrolase [Sedimentisphaerales bacterium]|nr:MBL fold metallo-hydrolase [Sedimentisphaerales bacterium]
MANKENLRICLAISIFFLSIAGLAQAATITVGSGAAYDFDTIQAGIDAAVDGDTVLVAPGEYVITEPVTFRGKAITVKSEAGPDETTIRMGTPADTNRGSVVLFENNETAASVLEGFTITEGKGSWLEDSWLGGGILFNASSGTVKNCSIVQNRVEGSGGGVFCAYPGSPILIDCIIAENSAGDSGGGVFAWGESSLTLTNCIIRGNSANRTGSYGGIGGGVGCYLNSSTTMTNCAIVSNMARVGGGLFCGDNSSVIMTHCAVIGNMARYAAGGIETYLNSSTTVDNCVFARNTAVSSCGGMNCSLNGGSAAVTNSIFWENTAPKAPEILVRSGGTLDITYSNVVGGQTGVSVEGGTLNWGEGNIDADPCFADPNNDDFHLKSEAGRWDPNKQTWVLDDVTSPCIDAGDPNSDWSAELWPHGERINMGAYGGTSQASMSLSDAGAVVYIQWLGHSTVKVWTEDCVVYVDPERVPESLHDATLVCVTHSHGDHYSPSDIAKVSNPDTQFIAPPDVVQQYGSGQTIAPGQTIEFDNVNIIAVPSYNTNKSNHPKSRNWVGFIIELGSKRIYVAGDTDLIEEMNTLGDIDVAILPAGGTYTMNAVEAAEATQYIKPELAIPYHWGQSVGTLSDAQTFAELAACAVKILTVGETISSDNWPKYSPLIAHWKLDETEGSVAYDSAGDNDGSCHGEPFWQPAGGKVDGALEFDGINDYISADFVLNPAEGAFSVFAWIKGGAAGQVIISQTDGTGTGEAWIGAETSDGKLMTGLTPPPAGRSAPQPLVSESVIIDGQWHHIGLVWNRSYRYLYVDGIEAAGDTTALAPLKASDGGLYIGAGKTLEAGSFFPGLIDDVRIYNRALSTEDIEELAR